MRVARPIYWPNSPACSRRSQKGVVALITAVMLPILILAAAMAIDLGHLFFAKRALQKVVDLAAVAAAQNPQNAVSTAYAVALQNGFNGNASGNALQVTLGTWNPAAGGACPPWRQNCTVPSYFQTGGSPGGAAQVQATESVPYFFIFGQRSITVGAVARNTNAAGFSLSSTLLNIDTQKSAILNAVLGGLLGTSLNINAVGYQGLINADVNLGQLAEALNVGTVSQLLQANIDLPGLYQGVLTALGQQGGLVNSQASGVIAGILGSGIQSGLKLQLGQILNLTAPSDAAAGQANINVFDLLTASAMLANSKHFIQIPNLGINLLGLVNVSVGLNVISPPSFAFGPPGQNTDGSWRTQAHTAQIALSINLGIGQALGGLVSLPIYLEVAPAQAHLTSLVCATPQTANQVTIGGNSGLLTLILGDIPPDAMNNTSQPLTASVQPATLINVLGLIRVAIAPIIVPVTGQGGSSNVQQGGITYDGLQFVGLPAQTQSINSNDLGNAIQYLLSELTVELQNPNALTVDVVGLNVGPLLGGVIDALLHVIVPALQPITSLLNTLLETLLDALGVSVGQANVTYNAVSCNAAVLVY